MPPLLYIFINTWISHLMVGTGNFFKRKLFHFRSFVTLSAPPAKFCSFFPPLSLTSLCFRFSFHPFFFSFFFSFFLSLCWLPFFCLFSASFFKVFFCCCTFYPYQYWPWHYSSYYPGAEWEKKMQREQVFIRCTHFKKSSRWMKSSPPRSIHPPETAAPPLSSCNFIVLHFYS